MTLLILIGLGLFSLALVIVRTRAWQHVLVPDWPAQVHGICYTPYRPGMSPQRGIYPSSAQIREDLVMLKAMTGRIRTYSVEGSLRHIPRIAQALGLKVTLGIWIGKDDARNHQEIALAIRLTRRFSCIDRVLVGNESLYDGLITFERLAGYLRHVRQHVDVPVSTSEQWHQWRDIPALVEQVDFIAAHILPYWEAEHFMQAGKAVSSLAQTLERLYPGKPLLISEVGWPSRGSVTKQTHSSIPTQTVAIRQQVNALQDQGYEYFVIEAFDQPWKTIEGLSGPHWGLFTARRRLKLQRTGPVGVPVDWGYAFSRLLGGSQPGARRTRRLLILCLTTYIALTLIGVSRLHDPMSWFGVTLTMIWAAFTLALLSVEIHEFLESQLGTEHPRQFLPIRGACHYRPFVSIHVACYNEPAAMVIQTLNALSLLHYPDYEVLVIDNNTSDPQVWEPVQRHCESLGPRFRFFHVAPLAGFKAGALNYLLEHTSAAAHIIAVIDSDYVIERNWLYEMVPHFQAPHIALIQAPQDYRDGQQSLFKRCCHAEYQGFFNIGMVIRNDYNAIIQHGTMTLIRHSILQALRWAPWCICEDAELGLRLLESGHATGYMPASYGKGLVPDTFLDFKKQRHRWAYGAMQIIKRHANSLIRARQNKLSTAQRYHFLAGWLPWMCEGINYLLIFATLFWSFIMLVLPGQSNPVPWIFAAPPIVTLLIRTLKIASLYTRLVSTDWKHAFAATLAGMALYPTIGKAVLAGCFTRGLPFFRTPKAVSTQGLSVALSHVREEVWLMVLLWTAALALGLTRGLGTVDMSGWVMLLLTQSLPCLAAVVMTILSCMPALGMRQDENG
ncbi:beta-(1-3)-glucosyl transferase [Pseudomonas sp. Leaf127]|nr:beta-(1-3)-glucosyl transferase [Pseudomonas sp. Leaf127]